MKALITIACLVMLLALVLEAQTTRRSKALHQTFTHTLWDDYAFDKGGKAADTSSAVYVGDVYLPSVRLFYKGDDNTAGANSLDVDIKFETYIPTVGWKPEDHYTIRQMTNTSWAMAQQYHIMPRVTATTIDNPGAGNALTYTAGPNNDTILYGLQFVFTTDETVDDRWVRVGLYDGSDNIVALAMCNTAQPASKSVIYSFYMGAENIYQEDPGTATVALPPDLYLREDYYIQTNIFGMQSGDAITSAVISSMVDVDPLLGYHLPIMADSIRFIALEGALIGSDEDIYLTITGQYLK